MSQVQVTNGSESTKTSAAREHLRPGHAVAPAVDIFENNDELLLVADVPGAVSEQVNVVFDRNELLLEARAEGARNQRPVLFRRSFEVRADVDASRISAELKHGVLSVRLPKSARSKPRQISVKTS